MNIRHFRELDVYQRAKTSALEISMIGKGFPADEKYSLTDQIRRASRSVCTNIAEAWRKRKYPAAFVAKLSDSLAEASETQVWLEFALAHQYVAQEAFDRLDEEYEHICAMLVKMSDRPQDWLLRG